VPEHRDPNVERPLDLRALLGGVLRQRRVATAIGLGIFGIVALLTALTPSTYVSRSQVLLIDRVREPGERPIWSGYTEVQIARSGEVARLAGLELDPVRDAEWVQDRTGARTPGDALDLVELRATSGSPAEAQQLATVLTDAYVAFSTSKADDQFERSLEVLTERRQAIESELAAVRAQLDLLDIALAQTPETDPQIQVLGAQKANLEQRRVELQREVDVAITGIDRARLELASVRTGLQIVEPATLPLDRAAPQTVRNLILGAIAAAVIGVLAALVVEHLRRRAWRWKELGDAAGAPVLAATRLRRGSVARASARLLLSWRPTDEELAPLLPVLDLLDVHVDSEIAPIVVVAAEDDPAGPLIALQLASVCAIDGIPAVVFDASPSPSPLSEVLDRAAEDPGALRPFLNIGRATDRSTTVEVALVALPSGLVSFPELPRPSVTVLAVTAGRCTPDEIRAVATGALEAGHPITGVVIANPEPRDPTAVPAVLAGVRERMLASTTTVADAGVFPLRLDRSGQPLTSLAVRRHRSHEDIASLGDSTRDDDHDDKSPTAHEHGDEDDPSEFADAIDSWERDAS
jgi:hypothetical protein